MKCNILQFVAFHLFANVPIYGIAVHLRNELNFWNVHGIMNTSGLPKGFTLHRQVSLAAVNQFYVNHEAMTGCKKSKDSLKACFENVNIKG